MTPTSRRPGWSRRANDDLANDLGNLVSRVVTLVHRYRQGKVPAGRGGATGARPAARLTGAHWRRHATRFRNGWPRALADFDFRGATAAIWEVVEEANRYVERAEPWRLARAERDGDATAGEQLDESLALLIGTCSDLGRELAPFLPGLAARIRAACDDSAGPLPPAEPVFPRLR